MARTVIDIDDTALAAAQKELGTRTKVETVNAALRTVAGRSERRAAIKEVVAMMPDYESYLQEKTDRTG